MNDKDNNPTEVEQTLEKTQRYRYLWVPEGCLKPIYIEKDGTVLLCTPVE